MHDSNNAAYDYGDEVCGDYMFFQIVFDEPVQDYIPERLLRYIKVKSSPETIVQKHQSAAERYEALEQLKLAAYKAQVARTDGKTREIRERAKLALARAKQRQADDMERHCEKRSVLLESKKQKLKSYHRKLRNRIEIVKSAKLLLNNADEHQHQLQQPDGSQIRRRFGGNQVTFGVASQTVLSWHEGLRVRTIYIDDGNYRCEENRSK